MSLRRILIVLAAAGLLMVTTTVLAAVLGGDHPRRSVRVAGGVTTLADAPVPPPTPDPAAVASATAAPTATPPEARSPSWRRHELRRLRSSRTVAGALRRAWLARRIDARTLAGYEATWTRARSTARRLHGVRGAELQAVIAFTTGLAKERRLTSSRLGPVLLTVRRNTTFWATRPLPRPRERFVFGRDPVVFGYEPGQGVQIHWLGTWGRANGRARFCLAHGARCPRDTLTRELRRLTGLASRRAGYAAYEGLYRFGGAPVWVSGMVQGTAVQALSRARRALDAPAFGLAARRALGAFEQRPPAGVAVAEGSGHHYLMYSFAPGLRILNGDLQAVTGLHDMAELTGSRRARRLFRSGERAARAAVARYDTGAWSLYSSGGRESTLSYHRLVDGFLGDLCARTRHGAYCGAARRFARYEREPPRIAFAARRRVRARRSTPIAFALSKGSHVVVEIRGVRGLAVRQVLDLSRGRHVVGWRPRWRGRYVVRVGAQGVSGPRAVRSRILQVLTAPPSRAVRRARAERRARAVRRARAARRARAERHARAVRRVRAERQAEAAERTRAAQLAGVQRRLARRKGLTGDSAGHDDASG